MHRITSKALLPGHRALWVHACSSTSLPSLALLQSHRPPCHPLPPTPPGQALATLELLKTPCHLPGRLFHFILIYFFPSSYHCLHTYDLFVSLAHCLFALLDHKSHEDRSLVCVIHCYVPSPQHIVQEAEWLGLPTPP